MARSGSVSVMRLLLENETDISAKTDKGLTSLHAAAENERNEAALLLIENGADITVQDSKGMTVLH